MILHGFYRYVSYFKMIISFGSAYVMRSSGKCAKTTLFHSKTGNLLKVSQQETSQVNNSTLEYCAIVKEDKADIYIYIHTLTQKNIHMNISVCVCVCKLSIQYVPYNTIFVNKMFMLHTEDQMKLCQNINKTSIVKSYFKCITETIKSPLKIPWKSPIYESIL